MLVLECTNLINKVEMCIQAIEVQICWTHVLRQVTWLEATFCKYREVLMVHKDLGWYVSMEQ